MMSEEINYLREILSIVEGIKSGKKELDDLSIVATKVIADADLENASNELYELIHDCFDYAVTPTDDGLKQIEVKGKEVAG